MVCDWPIERSCLDDAETPIDKQREQDAADVAVSVLWALSGRQFGVCRVIARPCPQPSNYNPWNSGPLWFPLWDGSNWRNVTCGCVGRCEVNGPAVVHLSGGTGEPVGEILEVRIAGEVLDESLYVLEGERLYRRGSNWPEQDLNKPMDDAGTWSVTYTRGNPVPAGVGVLVGLLTKEFINACCGGKCRIPRRVQTVSRAGVTYQKVDPTDIFKAGKTGLPEIDMWLASVNPTGAMAPVQVL